MASKDDAIREDFVQHLRRTIPAFKAETIETQMALAWMLWVSPTKRRRHSLYPDNVSFAYGELDEKFGRRKFLAVNARVRLFDLKSWSKNRGATKGYRPTEIAQTALREYLETRSHSMTRLLYGDGRVLKSLPAAVASKGMDGLTQTQWRNAKTILDRVQVNVVALKKLQKLLRDERDLWRETAMPANLFTAASPDALDRIDRLLECIALILRMAKTEVAGDGYIMHRYVMARSGRLYAKNVNLQTVPTPIKQAALAGLWEYDFANCHYAILMQMARRFGHECGAIADYLANKKATREAIATAAGISIDQAKMVLLAILYGAIQSVRADSAIPEEIGADRAKLLYVNEQFQAIRTDVGKARAVILAGWPRTANGRLSNALGKAIGNNQPAREKLAHLIQGAEAAALHAALDLYPKHIVLIQHDGFASLAKLDSSKIEAAVLSATGYQLALEEERIQVNVDEWIDRPQNPKRKCSQKQHQSGLQR